MNQLRKDRALIAGELPELAAKHQLLCDAAQEPTHSGALRRAVHASKILLDELADRGGTDLDTLARFLTGQGKLTSDVIDRLAKVLELKLESANGKPKPRRAKAD
ncbi:MAG TPA: helix-turn-helix transcriptional regulator [Pirellulales bacterium]|nr:helix-turn-helix transcriptional regulator [Pirellulales bacterium]